MKYVHTIKWAVLMSAALLALSPAAEAATYRRCNASLIGNVYKDGNMYYGVGEISVFARGGGGMIFMAKSKIRGA